jgi:hypothetical protein
MLWDPIVGWDEVLARLRPYTMCSSFTLSLTRRAKSDCLEAIVKAGRFYPARTRRVRSPLMTWTR